MLFLLVSYLFLLLFIYYFVRKCIEMQVGKYRVDVLPSADVLRYYYGSVVIIMGAIGLYSAIEDSWPLHAWICYFFGNILIAVVIYVYQTEGKYSLLVVWLLSIVMVIML